MSERFNVDIDDVLGSNYLVTSISCSSYNPTIDGTITLTVTVKDVYGTAVSGESVLVTASSGSFTGYNGSSITSTSSYTGTTNPSGQFTLTYTCTAWGLITFTANNTNTQVDVGGWKTVSLSAGSTYGTLYVNGKTRTAELRYVRTFSSATADTFYTWHSGAIPSAYRPSDQVNGSCNQAGAIYVDSTGEIGGKFANGWSSDRLVKGSVMWHY